MIKTAEQGEVATGCIKPIEFVGNDGRLVGINGARFVQLAAREYPDNNGFRNRLKELHLSVGTSPLKQVVELE